MEETAPTPKAKVVLILGALIFLLLLVAGTGYFIRSRTAPPSSRIPDLPQFSGNASLGIMEQSSEWEVAVSRDQVRSYYKKQLENSGWTINTDNRDTLTAVSGDTTYELKFSSQDGKTSVSLMAKFQTR